MLLPPAPFMEPPDEKTPAAVVPSAGGPLRDKPGVLVADDDHLVRVLVQLGLERGGFEVWLASNGCEAIDQYREHQEEIAVVLLDVCMPELDGPQTLDALRELNPEIPVCFMSGNAGFYGLDELRQRGAAHVIIKPFLMEELVHVLRQVVHGVDAELLSAGRIGPG